MATVSTMNIVDITNIDVHNSSMLTKDFRKNKKQQRFEFGSLRPKVDRRIMDALKKLSESNGESVTVIINRILMESIDLN